LKLLAIVSSFSRRAGFTNLNCSAHAVLNSRTQHTPARRTHSHTDGTELAEMHHVVHTVNQPSLSDQYS
jgi:hypothetical protein